MARIIPLPANRHEQVRSLLPWYVSGRLEPEEHARVEAHLADCAACRAEADSERRLEAGVAGLSLDVEHGWARMRRRIAARESRGGFAVAAEIGGRFFARHGAVGWALAAQALAIASVSLVLVSQPRAPRYVALGEPGAGRRGDAIVEFRPQATEAELRRTLGRAGAKIVDGPTAAGAYVLDIPAQSKAAALAALRHDPDVVMAEPIDVGDPP